MYFLSDSSDKQYFSSQKIDENVVFLATTHDKSGLTRRELPFVVTRNETLSGYRDCIHYPDILVCRSPAIDENLAEMYGYPVAYYWQGRTGNWSSGRFVGWNGVSGTLNFTDITDIVGNTWDENMYQEKKNYLW